MSVKTISGVILVIVFVAVTYLLTKNGYEEKLNDEKKNCETNVATEKTKYDKSLADEKEKAKYYTDIFSDLTNKVKDGIYKNYGTCVSLIRPDFETKPSKFYTKFPGDDGEENQTRTFWCSPYYTTTSAGADTRKSQFK